MKEFNYTIKDELGIHARPAGVLVKKASEFSSAVSIQKNGKSGDAKRIFSVMGLGIKCGDVITVRTEGSDEDAACAELLNFFENNL